MRGSVFQTVLMGYSNTAYLAYEAFFSQGIQVSAYCDIEKKEKDPFTLAYLGHESSRDTMEKLSGYNYFVCIRDNSKRKEVSEYLLKELGEPENAFHKTAILSRTINCGTGNLFGPRCVVNTGVTMGNGILLGTGCILDTNCTVGDYATLGAGVIVGEGAVIGTGAVLETGVVVNAGAVVPKGAVIKAGTVVD